MKQSVRKILSGLMITVMLTLCLMGSLTACSDASRLNRMEESERAVEFMKILDKNMESKKSSTSDITMDMTMELYGVEVKATVTGTVVTGNAGTEDYYTISDSLTTIEMAGETTEISAYEGFYQGKMFSSNTQDDESAVKLWSSISAADYEAFKVENSSTTVMDDISLVVECDTKTCVQNEDKTWTATYTDYTDKGLEFFDGMLDGFSTLLSDVHVADVVMTINASEALCPTVMEFEFVFELGENADPDTKLPEITGKVTYRDIDTTQPSEVDFSDYTEVADLRVPKIMKKSLTDFLNADKGEFEVNISTEITYAGQSQVTSEKDTGSFEVTEDGYTYNMTVMSDGESYRISYGNGKQTVSAEDLDQTTDTTDTEAKDSIASLLDPVSFNVSDARNIELVADRSNEDVSVYLVTLDDAYTSEYEEALGGIDLDGTATIEVTIENGKMTAQTFTLDMSGEGCTIILSAECVYISSENASDAETETQGEI